LKRNTSNTKTVANLQDSYNMSLGLSRNCHLTGLWVERTADDDWGPETAQQHPLQHRSHDQHTDEAQDILKCVNAVKAW